MKASFKLSVLILSLLLAVSVQAQTANTFCNRFSELSSKLIERMNSYEKKVQERTEQRKGMDERRTEQDAKLEEKRNEWNVKREEHFAKLEALAQNDEQKQAVIDFKKAVEEAIKARRDAMNEAIEDFRQAIDNSELKNFSINATLEAYKNSVQTALDKAQADCDSKVSSSKVRTAVMQGLKSAKNKLLSDYKKVEGVKGKSEEAREKFKEAKEKAISEFNEAMDKAKEDFKSAWDKEEE